PLDRRRRLQKSGSHRRRGRAGGGPPADAGKPPPRGPLPLRRAARRVRPDWWPQFRVGLGHRPSRWPRGGGARQQPGFDLECQLPGGERKRSAPMALMDFIKRQLIDIIEWTDDSRDTLSYRYPDEDKEIKNGAQLIVRESQTVQFVYLGEFGDTFGPGKHTLTTDNIPVLTSLKSWKYGFESPFKADVYYVTTRLFTGNKWGTSNPIMMRDADFGIVRVRAFGTYDFHIVDP